MVSYAEKKTWIRSALQGKLFFQSHLKDVFIRKRTETMVCCNWKIEFNGDVPATLILFSSSFLLGEKREKINCVAKQFMTLNHGIDIEICTCL